jgi:hypothetical protein
VDVGVIDDLRMFGWRLAHAYDRALFNDRYWSFESSLIDQGWFARGEAKGLRLPTRLLDHNDADPPSSTGSEPTSFGLPRMASTCRRSHLRGLAACVNDSAKAEPARPDEHLRSSLRPLSPSGL